eukprot:CAMPEP_0196583184 /NCGR_PEP_ID=MMETSP1081-20130531/42451_1 /TAXON_ID=36882 /ORGANISM="Pyramimonas amylifera, Strain CCMP720" /LENGTH=358 /DNA_ID=CAMNT_0041903995 /DNA_START=166 /DNA_END=1242 /DNA_ORIENTATION=-
MCLPERHEISAHLIHGPKIFKLNPFRRTVTNSFLSLRTSHLSSFCFNQPSSRGGEKARVCTSATSGKGGKTAQLTVQERSVLVNEDLLMFFFKSDLTTRLQRALNLEQPDIAKQLQNKIQEVSEAIKKKRASNRGAPTQEDTTNRASQGLMLRAELRRAIEEERYEDAAAIKVKLSAAETDSLAASLSAAAASQAREFPFRLGQRIVHKTDSWVGLVCGYDESCFESTEWQEEINASDLGRGVQQPFYQVLVDKNNRGDYDVAYVPEERLLAFEDIKDEDGVEPPGVEHPYTYLLFFGMDKKGNYIPTRSLRDKYKVERFDDPDLMEDTIDEDDAIDKDTDDLTDSSDDEGNDGKTSK